MSPELKLCSSEGSQMTTVETAVRPGRRKVPIPASSLEAAHCKMCRLSPLCNLCHHLFSLQLVSPPLLFATCVTTSSLCNLCHLSPLCNLCHLSPLCNLCHLPLQLVSPPSLKLCHLFPLQFIASTLLFLARDCATVTLYF